VQLAEKAGVEIATRTMVVGWTNVNTIQITLPLGVDEIQADAIVLATGCRERPRSARLVPGSRPAGIFTTGALQQWTYLHHHPIGKRAVVVGAEHVSFSAVITLKHAGVEVAAIVTDQPCHQSFFAYKLITADRWRVPLLTGSVIANIRGKKRVESVEIADIDGSDIREIACDTVIFTGNWIPDHELARLGGLTFAANTKGPLVDTQLRTSSKGVFAVGNLIHAAETADVAAVNGRFVAEPVRRYLESGDWQNDNIIPIEIDEHIDWISPQAIAVGVARAPNRMLSLRVNAPLHRPTLEIWQGERLLWRKQYRRLMPNLPIHIPDKFMPQLRPTGAVSLRMKLN
jgi:NADPH-dependent 2,4-dienoyl-CoA reductase/sulfur reductase-like enzyme